MRLKGSGLCVPDYGNEDKEENTADIICDSKILAHVVYSACTLWRTRRAEQTSGNIKQHPVLIQFVLPSAIFLMISVVERLGTKSIVCTVPPASSTISFPTMESMVQSEPFTRTSGTTALMRS